MTALDTAPVQRPLTDTEIDAILARIDAASSTGELLSAAVDAVYRPLLADLGLSMAALPGGGKIDPRRFAIPSVQWHAIMTAVTSRAAQWGTGPELALSLINVMPGGYDDPAIKAPAAVAALPDRRPYTLNLHVSRDACDVIAAATGRVQAISRFYGEDSVQAHIASGSLLAALSRLFSMSFGAETHISRDSDLGLFARTASGFVYGLFFHGDTRRCTAGDGCTAVIADDGTAHTLSSTGVLAAHAHEPSFPVDAPRPGSWSFHS